MIDTKKLEEVVRKEYPLTSSYKIARSLGVHPTTVYRCAKRLGVEKDKNWNDKKKSSLALGRICSEEKRKKMSKTHKAIYKKELFRVLSGIPQKTRIKILRIPKKTANSMRGLRFRHNYFFDDVNDLTLYYDSETKRAKNEHYFEKKYNIHFLPADE